MQFKETYKIFIEAFSFVLGAVFAIFVPTTIHVIDTRAKYSSIPESPNMDPGVAWYICSIIAIPLLFIAILSETIRLFYFRGNPLSLIGGITLGMLIALPSTFGLLPFDILHGWYPTLVAAIIFLIIFYIIRLTVLRKKNATNAA